MHPQDNIQEPSYYDFLMNHRPKTKKVPESKPPLPLAEPPPVEENASDEKINENKE